MSLYVLLYIANCVIRRPPLERGTKLRRILNIRVSLYSPCWLLPNCLYVLYAAMLSDRFSGPRTRYWRPISPDSNFWSTPGWPLSSNFKKVIEIEPKSTTKFRLLRKIDFCHRFHTKTLFSEPQSRISTQKSVSKGIWSRTQKQHPRYPKSCQNGVPKSCQNR